MISTFPYKQTFCFHNKEDEKIARVFFNEALSGIGYSMHSKSCTYRKKWGLLYNTFSPIIELNSVDANIELSFRLAPSTLAVILLSVAVLFFIATFLILLCLIDECEWIYCVIPAAFLCYIFVFVRTIFLLTVKKIAATLAEHLPEGMDYKIIAHSSRTGDGSLCFGKKLS